MTTTLHSIAIFVTDLDRARDFYVDQLGLPLNKAGTFGLELLDAPPHIGVHPAEHPDAREMVGRHTGITLRVAGLLEVFERLAGAGVTVVVPPAQQSFGIMALVADPDGNVVALWEDNVSPASEE
ncbi:MAG: VOC family protein [Gemmatimonadales bacterium]